jgi:hypothetical protein
LSACREKKYVGNFVLDIQMMEVVLCRCGSSPHFSSNLPNTLDKKLVDDKQGLFKAIQTPIMTAPTEPAATLSHLYRADGSATFSQNGYTVIGAVNGPIEVQRRDELPEEAVVDVTVRPAAGVGGKTDQKRYKALTDQFKVHASDISN